MKILLKVYLKPAFIFANACESVAFNIFNIFLIL